MTDSLISVIIPTRNSEVTIETCIKSIKSQTFSNIEIIVVDNYSSDNTREIAEKLDVTFLIKGFERSAQRNFGAKQASGKYLLFVDSDMELTPKVVEECVDIADSNEVFAVIIPEISVGEGYWAKCKALEKLCYIGDETMEAARFFRAEIFWKMGGYDENIAGGGEDWDLPLRVKKAGYKIGRVNALIQHHEGKFSLLGSMKKKYYYSKTIERYIMRHPETARKQLTPFRRAFFRNRSFTKDPLHAIGLIFMKICEFTAGSLGFIKTKIWR